MNFRSPGTLAAALLGVGLFFLPGRGLMEPTLWFGQPEWGRTLIIAVLIFCVVYFGTLKFWALVTGDRLQKPLPAILALGLGIRLAVDCARILMWR